MPWRTTDRPAWKHSVNVDHLDGDRLNNDPDNLVPSCGWCNTNRGWMQERYPHIWLLLRLTLRNVHPADRPSPLGIIADLTGTTLDHLIAERKVA